MQFRFKKSAPLIRLGDYRWQTLPLPPPSLIGEVQGGYRREHEQGKYELAGSTALRADKMIE